MRAWSSAVRTRIGPGPAPILGLLPIRLLNLLSQEPESATSLPAAISNSRRNTQLDLRSDSLLAPDFQPPAKSLGTFAHTRQAPMTSTGALIGNFRSDSDSVVSHVKLELRISVSDFRFNLLRPCETLFATHGRRRLKRKSLTEIRSSSFTCETTESESLLKLPIRAPVLVIGACLVCANVPRDLAGGWKSGASRESERRSS